MYELNIFHINNLKKSNLANHSSSTESNPFLDYDPHLQETLCQHFAVEAVSRPSCIKY